jgi:uncharacterized protein DUF6879
MTRWIRSTSDPEWAALFSGFERSAFRLEGQQMYSNASEDAPLARFLTGQPVEFDLTWRLSKTRAESAPDRTTTTVRIVVEPPSLYTRFELAVYPQLVAAGEDIRIIAVPEGCRPAELPLHDFWMFDERDVWKMHYYENFRFAGAELLDTPDDVSQHLRWRDVALARAVPLQKYLASREHTHDSETTTA